MRDAPPHHFYRTVDQWTYMDGARTGGGEMDVLLGPMMINTSLELGPRSCREAPRTNTG